eukprot:scaffold80080_cov23-Prasinocladus_malaysianus.AAC.1
MTDVDNSHESKPGSAARSKRSLQSATITRLNCSVDEQGRPHGYGLWTDTHWHGETLEVGFGGRLHIGYAMLYTMHSVNGDVNRASQLVGIAVQIHEYTL